MDKKEKKQMQQEAYNEYVKQKSPNSPILKDCFNAFWVGGLICSIGQIILDFCMFKEMDNTINSWNINQNYKWNKIVDSIEFI